MAACRHQFLSLERPDDFFEVFDMRGTLRNGQPTMQQNSQNVTEMKYFCSFVQS
jgi:hypothetical protein